MWRMAGQDGSGASGERERERLCSGNQDSFYTVVLISPQARQSLRYVCVRECVCVCKRACICMFLLRDGQLCVPPHVLNSHLCMFNPSLCGNWVHMLFFPLNWLEKVLCACYVCNSWKQMGVDCSPLCQVCEHLLEGDSVWDRETVFLLSLHNRVRLLLRTQDYKHVKFKGADLRIDVQSQEVTLESRDWSLSFYEMKWILMHP